MEYESFSLIPKDRIGVLIGKNGEVKDKIEEKTGVELEINSETGEIKIIRKEDTDPVKAMKAKKIIDAIGKKFSPEKAMKIARENVRFRTIDLKKMLDSPKEVKRQKSRLIGTEGKTKRKLQRKTGTQITIDKKTVNIIGTPQELQVASQAVMRLVEGSKHSNVYRFIEKRMI